MQGLDLGALPALRKPELLAFVVQWLHIWIFVPARCLFSFQVALVYGQMNEPPGARARVGLTALTVAEYFRDQEGQDVLLFIDNIFRFTQAGSEVNNSSLCVFYLFY